MWWLSILIIADTGVVAYAAHPGVVATDMGRHMSAGVQQFTKSVMAKVVRTPEQGAQTSLHCALNEKLAEQHKKIYYRYDRLPAKEAKLMISHNFTATVRQDLCHARRKMKKMLNVFGQLVKSSCKIIYKVLI